MDKTTQTIHHFPLVAGHSPIAIDWNPTARWLSITPAQINLDDLPVLIFGLQQVDMERKRNWCATTTRKSEE